MAVIIVTVILFQFIVVIVANVVPNSMIGNRLAHHNTWWHLPSFSTQENSPGPIGVTCLCLKYYTNSIKLN